VAGMMGRRVRKAFTKQVFHSGDSKCSLENGHDYAYPRAFDTTYTEQSTWFQYPFCLVEHCYRIIYNMYGDYPHHHVKRIILERHSLDITF
jgi:hypothetical protein